MVAANWLQVPFTLYLMTHAYFSFYHAVANVAIRLVRARVHPWAPAVAEGATVLVLGYAMALGESLTIAHFPYYDFEVPYSSSPMCDT